MTTGVAEYEMKSDCIISYKTFVLQTAMDQLHMHFTSAIHNTAFKKVLGFVELHAGTGDSNFQKRQYNDLCKVSPLLSTCIAFRPEFFIQV